MKTLMIDRTMWYRGKNSGNSKLLRKVDGKMCCLGFYSLACGLTEENITDKFLPSSILNILPEEMKWLLEDGTTDKEEHRYWSDCNFERMLSNINDCTLINDENREKFLSDIMGKYSVEITFIN